MTHGSKGYSLNRFGGGEELHGVGLAVRDNLIDIVPALGRRLWARYLHGYQGSCWARRRWFRFANAETLYLFQGCLLGPPAAFHKKESNCGSDETNRQDTCYGTNSGCSGGCRCGGSGCYGKPRSRSRRCCLGFGATRRSGLGAGTSLCRKLRGCDSGCLTRRARGSGGCRRSERR
jgi:hypothetical protein